jgi:transposase
VQFKRQIVEACLAKETSVPKVALAHSLNANMVHCWIRQAHTDKLRAVGGFVALAILVKTAASPAPLTTNQSGCRSRIATRVLTSAGQPHKPIVA